MKLYTWSDLPIEQVSDNIARKMIVGEKEMLVRWEFRKGGLAGRHDHPHEQIVMMVSGRLRLAVGNEERVLVPGDLVIIPPHTPHEAEALEDTIVIDIFSPPREDFLSGSRPAYLD